MNHSHLGVRGLTLGGIALLLVCAGPTGHAGASEATTPSPTTSPPPSDTRATGGGK